MKKVLLATVIIAALAAACKKAEAPKKQQTQVFAVTVMTAQEGPLSSYLPLAGDIISGSTVDAYSDAAGKVTRVYVSVGARVSAGQAIAAVDPSKPGMRYVEYVVRAPITGTIIALPAEVGMTVGVSTSIARLAGGGGLEIQLFVPERYIARVGMAMPCEINLDAYPGEVFRGVVREVSPVVDPTSRTMLIKINVDNPGARLKAGMFAKVKVITESKSAAVKVPQSAVITRQGKKVVFVAGSAGLEDEPDALAARQREVETGIESDGIIEIVSGISAGDEVVDKGMTLLVDEARINVISRDGVTVPSKAAAQPEASEQDGQQDGGRHGGRSRG